MTVKHYLDQLPEVIRAQAIKNILAQKGETTHVLNHETATLELAIGLCFDWVNTPEGVDYWISVSDGKIPVSTDCITGTFIEKSTSLSLATEKPIEPQEFHIVYFKDKKDVYSNGKNYFGFTECDAIMTFRAEFPEASFHSMYKK